MALPMAASLVGGGVSGGAGGIDLSGGPATSQSGGDTRTGGAVFNFAPPQSVQQTQAITSMAPWFVVAVVILWLMLRK